jgi:hypothetical protein
MENVDWDKWDKLADTSDVEARVDPSIYSEADEEAEQFEPESRKQLPISCEYPHVNEFGRKVPCPNPATRIAFRVDHSDPENPELHQSGVGCVCDAHAQQTHLTHEALKQVAIARAAESRSNINLNRTTLHTPEFHTLQDGLSEAGIRKGSTEDKEAQLLMMEHLARNVVSYKGKPVPVDINTGVTRALTIGQGQEIEQPKELTPLGQFLNHVATKTYYQKQITDHNAGKHTVDDYNRSVENADSGNIEKACPQCLTKGRRNTSIRLAKRYNLTFGPLGVYAPHPADTERDKETKRKEIEKQNLLRTSTGLDPITDETGSLIAPRTAGRPSTLESGDTGYFTVPSTTWSIEQAIPWGTTTPGNPRAEPYADLVKASTGEGTDGEDANNPPVPFAARRREFDSEGNLKNTQTINGKQVVVNSPRVNIVTSKQPYGARAVAPYGRNQAREVSPLRLNRLALSLQPEAGFVAFPMAIDYSGTEEYPDLDVRQHPYVDPNLGTPIAWHNGRAVHVLRGENPGGGTVWIPDEKTPAMKHTSDCLNKDSYPYRSACKAGCKNLTHAEVRGATQASHIQAAEGRRTPGEQMEDLAGAFAGRRAHLQAKGFIRMLHETGGSAIPLYDKKAIVNHLKSLGHDVSPEDIPDNLSEALEQTYTGQDIRGEHYRIRTELRKQFDSATADEQEAMFSRISYPQTFRPELERGKGLPPNPTFYEDIQAAKAKAQADAEAAKAAKKSVKKKAKKRSISGRVKTRTVSPEELNAIRQAAADRKSTREVITKNNQ